MFEKTNFDYSQEWEKQILEQEIKAEQYDALFDAEQLEDKLRSKNVKKQYRKYLQSIGQL